MKFVGGTYIAVTEEVIAPIVVLLGCAWEGRGGCVWHFGGCECVNLRGSFWIMDARAKDEFGQLKYPDLWRELA